MLRCAQQIGIGNRSRRVNTTQLLLLGLSACMYVCCPQFTRAARARAVSFLCVCAVS